MTRRAEGRRKVEIVKMQNESNLQVTFSKRKSGLFKKASELCTFCGAEVAIIVFSPGKHVFSFGHPSVEKVVDRFLSGSPFQPEMSRPMELNETRSKATAVHYLNSQFTEVLEELEFEKRRREEIGRISKASEAQCCWGSSIQELGLPQLLQLKMSLDTLKTNVASQAEMLKSQSPNAFGFRASSSIAGPALNPFNPNVYSSSKETTVATQPEELILQEYFASSSNTNNNDGFNSSTSVSKTLPFDNSKIINAGFSPDNFSTDTFILDLYNISSSKRFHLHHSDNNGGLNPNNSGKGRRVFPYDASSSGDPNITGGFNPSCYAGGVIPFDTNFNGSFNVPPGVLREGTLLLNSNSPSKRAHAFNADNLPLDAYITSIGGFKPNMIPLPGRNQGYGNGFS